jgi:hypothetical protein
MKREKKDRGKSEQVSASGGEGGRIKKKETKEENPKIERLRETAPRERTEKK